MITDQIKQRFITMTEKVSGSSMKLLVLLMFGCGFVVCQDLKVILTSRSAQRPATYHLDQEIPAEDYIFEEEPMESNKYLDK